MPSRYFPVRPNLEHLKKQAKALLNAAQARDIDALRRFTIVPALSGKSPDQISASDLALHDAQSAIAREHGFTSWNALREEVESRTLSFDAAVDEFITCATAGATGRAERLLALHPRIASATFHTALVLGDVAMVEEQLRVHPEVATQAGGPQGWEPLLYVCHTSMHKRVGSVEGLTTIARRLCALGANPNAEYHWNWHPELPRTGPVGRRMRGPPPAARRGAARRGRESHRRRHVSYRRRRRQPGCARTCRFATDSTSTESRREFHLSWTRRSGQIRPQDRGGCSITGRSESSLGRHR